MINENNCKQDKKKFFFNNNKIRKILRIFGHSHLLFMGSEPHINCLLAIVPF